MAMISRSSQGLLLLAKYCILTFMQLGCRQKRVGILFPSRNRKGEPGLSLAGYVSHTLYSNSSLRDASIILEANLHNQTPLFSTKIRTYLEMHIARYPSSIESFIVGFT